MGAHVLELAREHEVGKLVIVGTVCAYPKFAAVPFDENDLWNGYPEETNAPYGVAKKSILVGAQAYREQYGLNSIFLLPANLYGPRDRFDERGAHVIPDLIRKMTESPERVILWGDGSPSREFLSVEDCADGLALAGDRYDGADPVNLGTGVETTIKELAAAYSAPILALSARFRQGLGGSEAAAHRLHVCKVLPKPFSREELLYAVGESIEHP